MKRLNIWSMRMNGVGPRFCFWIRPASMVVLVFSAKNSVSWDANLIVGWPEPFTSSIWRQRFVVPMVHIGLLWITMDYVHFHIFLYMLYNHFLTSWPNNSNMSFVTWLNWIQLAHMIHTKVRFGDGERDFQVPSTTLSTSNGPAAMNLVEPCPF